MATESATRTYFVRVCPYDPKRGFTARSVVKSGERITDQWREMSAGRIVELRLRDQKQENGIQPMFQICTHAEALELEAQALDRENRSVLNASRMNRVTSVRTREAAVNAKLTEARATETSEDVQVSLDKLEADLVAKENDEATAEATAAKLPPPPPAPRKGRGKAKASAE